MTYARLRSDLEELAGSIAFCDPVYGKPRLWCQVIYDSGSQKIDWAKFKQDNSQRNQEWQEWELSSERAFCVRFFGNECGLPFFKQFAEKAFKLVQSLSTTEGVQVKLPQETGCLGWLMLVLGTARCYSTATLQAVPGSWNHSGVFDLEAPFYEELRSNLFQSSIEAIRYWLNPLEAEPGGDYIEKSPIILPPPPERDGPCGSKDFWFKGKKYGEFSGRQMELLECLWGRPEGVPIGEVRELVEKSEEALKSLKRRVNTTLSKQGCPSTIRSKNGHYFLE